MPVRDADIFMGVEPEDVLTGANRGASGIDGIVASACGFAAGCRRMTTLVIGDLALIHDLNALALAAASDYPVIIVAVNNDGGGIFHFLPIAEFGEYFERCFGTPHGLRFENAAALFGLAYYHPTTAKEFDDDYRRAKAGGTSALIEITSDRRQNAVEHRNIRSQLRRLLE
jgi:2-succinyl-5-enolpyruvyl-6-hydroxy-3-cyclohexene-1-carboxylate synthase